MAKPTPQTIKVLLEQIQHTKALVCRAEGVNEETVEEYAEALKSGAVFPAVVLFRDGEEKLWIGDGHHRIAAHERAGLVEVEAEVRAGSQKDALVHAAGANKSHGLRRTNADKRHAILLVLAQFPEWASNHIADVCGVSNKTVDAARATLGNSQSARVGADGKKYRPRKNEAKAAADRRAKAAASLEKARSAIHKAGRLWPEAGEACQRLSAEVLAVAEPLRAKRAKLPPAAPAPKPGSPETAAPAAPAAEVVPSRPQRRKPVTSPAAAPSNGAS